MGWVKIKKENANFLVSTESYNELFKKQGYEIVKDSFSPPIKNSENIQQKAQLKIKSEEKSEKNNGKAHTKTKNQK